VLSPDSSERGIGSGSDYSFWSKRVELHKIHGDANRRVVEMMCKRLTYLPMKFWQAIE